MAINLSQVSQFKIRKLEVISRFGNINISQAYQEINIYDSIFMPCMRGEVLIQDAVGLIKRMLLDGSEFLHIVVSKDDETTDTLYENTFRIHKVTNRQSLNQTSESYLLHFISEEMIYSMQQRIRQAFEGLTYSEMAVTIMVKFLGLTGDKIGLIEPSKGVHSHVMPNLTPFDAMKWITKRALNEENLPNFLFFENKRGYSFTTLSRLISEPTILDINLEQKSISVTKDSSFLSAKEMKVVNQYDVLSNIQNGVYSGKFVGFDTITRKIIKNDIDFTKTYGLTEEHLNLYPNFSSLKNKEGLDVSQMPDSKVSLFPFEDTRLQQKYVSTNDLRSATKINKTHFYIFQRRPIFANLMQTTVHLTVPGNFALSSGYNIYLKVPSRSSKLSDGVEVDETLDGKYIITATHHLIRRDRHETVMEVATDSTNRQFIT